MLPTEAKTLSDIVIARRSVYTLTKQSPISDSEIRSIVEWAIKHCPSSFNVQSARAAVLLGANHEKLWDIGAEKMKTAAGDEAFKYLEPKIKGFRDAYGTVLWFEDEAALMGLQQKQPMVAGLVGEWSDQSSGMHQFAVWTAFEQAGLGCNLQHYNMSPQFSAAVRETWDLPATWKLHAQLVFGQPSSWDRARERTYEPIEKRVQYFE